MKPWWLWISYKENDPWSRPLNRFYLHRKYRTEEAAVQAMRDLFKAHPGVIRKVKITCTGTWASYYEPEED